MVQKPCNAAKQSDPDIGKYLLFSSEAYSTPYQSTRLNRYHATTS
jgi:hypothetical protein